MIEATWRRRSTQRAREFQYPSNRVVDRSDLPETRRPARPRFQYPSNRVVDRSCPHTASGRKCLARFSTLQIGSLIEAMIPPQRTQPVHQFQYPSNRVVDRSDGRDGRCGRSGLFQYPSNRVVDRSGSALSTSYSVFEVSVPFKSGR